MMMVVIMMRLMLLHHLFPSDTAHDPTKPAKVQSEFRRLFSHSILERIPCRTSDLANDDRDKNDKKAMSLLLSGMKYDICIGMSQGK